MKGDFTRSTFKPEKRYSSVRMQQGRVQLDADWNEQMDINSYRIEREARDVIGPCGVPWDKNGGGFKIGTTSDKRNLTISPGRIYVDGILCENFKDTYNYITNQDDLPGYYLLKDQGVYLAYLDVWQRHITDIEDPQIREVALGGPDTATRTKTVWQVKLKKVSDNLVIYGKKIDCDVLRRECDNVIKKSDGQLAAFTKQETSTKNPCIISPSAGYQRLQNQLYRVEIHKGGNADQATFKWSRDNGSVVFPIEEFINGSSGKTKKLKVKHLGRDKTLSLQADNLVEVLDDAVELSENPAGALVQITGEPNAAERIITLDTDVEVSDKKYHPKVRRWDQENDAIPVTSDPIELEGGIYVRFSGNNFRAGDYWLIPARTATENTQETGKIEWPLDKSNNPRYMPPEGIVHHSCCLAVLRQDENKKWDILSDLRKIFPSVTELTSFFHVCGDGQEAMPGEELPLPLQVGVSNGNRPVKDAFVMFEVKEGGGTVSADSSVSINPLIVETDSEGVAKCKWELGNLDPNNPNVPRPQLVEAKLLNCHHEPINTPPIRFNANLSVASQVAYTIPCCEANPVTCTYAYITNFDDDTVSVIDTATNKVTATIPVGTNPQGVTVNQDGTKVYVANLGNSDNPGTVSVIDTATNKVTATIPVGDSPRGVAVSPDGTKVYATNSGEFPDLRGTVSVIDTAKNSVAATVPVGDSPRGVAVTPDGKKVYVANRNSNNVSVIDTATNTVRVTVPTGGFPDGVAVNSTGTKVYVATSGRTSDDTDVTVFVIDTATDKLTAKVKGEDVSAGVAVTPDGKRVYVTDASEHGNNVYVIDTETNNVTAIVPVGKDPFGVAVTPDGKKVYVANRNSNNVSVIEVETNTVIDMVKVGRSPVAFGQFIVPASSFHTFNVASTNFQYQGWGQYPLVNLFGENNVPLLSNNDPIWNSHVNKLARLILDSKEKHDLKTGDKLDLPPRYSLLVRQIDIDGQKVWLEFDKDVQHVADQIIEVENGNSLSNTWEVMRNNIQDENNVPVLRVHVNQVSQGEIDNFVKIDGIWLIDYVNAKTHKIGDNFGDFTLTNIIYGVDESNLGSLIFESIKNPANRFPTVKELFEEKISVWPPKNKDNNTSVKGILDTFLCNFNAAHLPLDCDLCEKLKDDKNVKTVQDALNALCRRPGGGGCCIVVKDEEDLKNALEVLENGSKICLLPGDFKIDRFPLKCLSNIVISGCTLASRLVANIEVVNCKNVVIENLDISGNISVKGGGNFTLKKNKINTEGQILNVTDCPGAVIESNMFLIGLGQGYALEAKQVDIDGEKVWLEFTRNGEFVDDAIIPTETGSDKTWNVELDSIQEVYNVTVLRVHVDKIFSSAVGEVAQIDGLWLIDYANAITLQIFDRFGEFVLIEINDGDEFNPGSLVFERTNQDNGSIQIEKHVVSVNYQYWCDETYPVIHLFGENYVPLRDEENPKYQVNKLAKLVLDGNDKYIIKTGVKDWKKVLVFERSNDLKIRHNIIKRSLPSLGGEGIYPSISVSDSANTDIKGNLIQILSNGDLDDNVSVPGISLVEGDGHVSVANNRVNALNGPSLEIKSNGDTIKVHENYFKSNFNTLDDSNTEEGTSNTIKILSSKSRIIFTDNFCDSYNKKISPELGESDSIILIRIEGKDTVFSNNRCYASLIVSPNLDIDPFLYHVYLHPVANVIGNRCEENIQQENSLRLFSIGARESTSILLGNITSNDIQPTPNPGKLNLRI